MAWLAHITGPAERWDHLAYRYYGDANRTGPIIAANRHLFEDGLTPVAEVLPHGLTLRVPILAAMPIAADTLPPWKR